MTNTISPARWFYMGSAEIETVRAALAAHNWQISTQVAHVERAAVIQLVIDWAQGRTDVPEQVAAVIDDSHIGSGNSGYSADRRMNMILEYLASKQEVGTRTPHGTRAEVLYAPVDHESLKNLLAWVETQPMRETPAEFGEADETLEEHPNIRKALKRAGVTDREDRAAVMAHCHFRRNISGGRTSDWISAAADALKRAGSPEALMAQDQADNEALMARDRRR